MRHKAIILDVVWHASFERSAVVSLHFPVSALEVGAAHPLHRPRGWAGRASARGESDSLTAELANEERA